MDDGGRKRVRINTNNYKLFIFIIFNLRYYGGGGGNIYKNIESNN